MLAATHVGAPSRISSSIEHGLTRTVPVMLRHGGAADASLVRTREDQKDRSGLPVQSAQPNLRTLGASRHVRPATLWRAVRDVMATACDFGSRDRSSKSVRAAGIDLRVLDPQMPPDVLPTYKHELMTNRYVDDQRLSSHLPSSGSRTD